MLSYYRRSSDAVHSDNHVNFIVGNYRLLFIAPFAYITSATTRPLSIHPGSILLQNSSLCYVSSTPLYPPPPPSSACTILNYKTLYNYFNIHHIFFLSQKKRIFSHKAFMCSNNTISSLILAIHIVCFL